MTEKTGVIYKWTNIVTGKSYIGQTINEHQRYNQHKRYFNNKTGKSKFHKAIQEYKDIKLWEYSIIESNINRNNLNDREIFWIKYYDSFNNGYNSTTGGNQKTKFYEFSEEHKRKLSELAKNRTPEHRRKLSESLKGKTPPIKGKHLSAEAKEKIRQSKLGKSHKPMSLESRQKSRISNLGQKRTPETCKHISESLKGKTPPTKGKHRVYDENGKYHYE